MIYSGLDWSGSPGATHGPWLVFAVVHIQDAHLATIDDEFAVAKRNLRVAQDFVFKHADAADPVLCETFAAMQRTPMESRVHVLDKAAWRAAHGGRAKGNDLICGGIIHLVMACPDRVVARQVLLVDPPSNKLIRELRTTINQSFRGARRTGFRDVRPRRDHDADGAVIQAADLIAGEMRRHGAIAGPHLPGLAAKLHIV